MLDVGGWPSRRPLCQSSAVHTPPGSQLWCGEGLMVLAQPCLGDEGVAGAGDVAGIGDGENSLGWVSVNRVAIVG